MGQTVNRRDNVPGNRCNDVTRAKSIDLAGDGDPSFSRSLARLWVLFGTDSALGLLRSASCATRSCAEQPNFQLAQDATVI